MRSAIGMVIVLTTALGCSGPGNCAKDSDCKGDRVCVSGQCAEPARPETSATAAPSAAPAPVVATGVATAQPKGAGVPAQRQDSPFAQLQLNPGGVLTVSNVQIDKSGLINSYRQLSQITISNKSSIAATGVSGEVTWIDSTGKAAGSTTFSTTGIVPAGGSQTFSKGTLTTTKIQTKADIARARVTSASPSEP